jgi:hypothetical protein
MRMRGSRAASGPAGRLGALAVMLIATASTGRAASVTYTTVADSFMQRGQVPEFDPALGLLTEVDVRASESTFALFQYLSMPEPLTVSYTFLGQIILARGHIPILVGGGARTYVVPPFTSGFMLTDGFAADVAWTQASLLADFYGTGQIGVGVGGFFTLVDAPTVVPDPLNHATTGSGANVAVTYVYLAGAMPGPSSLTMAVIGLAMLAAARKRPARGDRSGIRRQHPSPGPTLVRRRSK